MLTNHFRLYFLSRAEVLSLLCETRDPNLVQGFLHLCYAGIQSLEFDEMLEAQAMISAKGERLPFLTPLRTKEAKGCVEKWMMQVRKGC